MTTPLWVLLAFSIWTLLVLFFGVGIYRVHRVLSGQAEMTEFRGGVDEGAPIYCRAMRAHANCVEDLPIYAALAVTAAIAGIDTPRLDQLAIAILIARIGQSLVHMIFPETKATVGVRFAFFSVQLVAFFWMAIIIATTALAAQMP